MRVAQPTRLLSALLSVTVLVHAIGLDCEQVRDNGADWNLKKLGGPRSVHFLQTMSTGKTENLTFTIDICKPLRSSADGCLTGARICAAKTIYDKDEKPGDEEPIDEWAVAGDFGLHNGQSIDAHFTRLKGSDSIADADKEGVRISIEGGSHGTGAAKLQTKAVIEFICDHNKTGNEKPTGESQVRRQDDGNDDLPDPDKGQSLQFISYKPQTVDKKDMEVLQLEWRTKWACEKQDNGKDDDKKKDEDKDDDDSNSRWGFFTWFIIILFLAIATYLIFGSWLNYNRYGARGWDLLPHGDTIRDVPYLFKEWGRRIVSGGGTRGGYNRI